MIINPQLLSNTPLLSQKHFGISHKSSFPLVVHNIDNRFLLCAYQGKKQESPLDIIVKYRQVLDYNSNPNDWSRIRTPSHNHWLVDVLVKRFEDEAQTKAFIDVLLNIWENVIQPFQDDSDRLTQLSNIPNLYQQSIDESKFGSILNYGFYSIRFLFFLATMLMYQEKTNYPDGVLFQGMLRILREDTNDLFSIFQSVNWRR